MSRDDEKKSVRANLHADDREHEGHIVVSNYSDYVVGKSYPLIAAHDSVCVAKYGETGLVFHILVRELDDDGLALFRAGEQVDLSFTDIADVGFFTLSVGRESGGMILECPFHPSISLSVSKQHICSGCADGVIPVTILVFTAEHGVLKLIRQFPLDKEFSENLLSWIENHYDSVMTVDEVKRASKEVYGAYKAKEIQEQAVYCYAKK